MVTALVALDVAGGAVLRHAHSRSTANPLYRPLAVGATTLVLGSSTGKRGFDPAALWPHSYNAAEDGQGIFFVAAFMRNLPAQSAIRRVVVGIDPDEIVSGFRSNNTRHLKRLAPLAITDTKLRAQLGLSDPLVRVKYWSGLYPFRGEFARVLLQWIAPRTVDNGYVPLTRSMAEAPPRAAIPGPPPPPSAEGLEAMRDIVSAARARGIALVAAVTPTAGGHRREREPFYAPAMIAVRQILADGRTCDLTAIDASEIDAIANQHALFHDSAHLNATGARKYTDAIRRLVELHCPWVTR
jgi:hypothetical protein